MELEAFRKLALIAFDPDILRCGEEIRRLADFDIPEDRQAPFHSFHQFITNPAPKYILEWRADPARELRWYGPHVDGILGSVRSALAAAHYHLAHLTEIENAVLDLLDRHDLGSRMGKANMAFGQTRQMDFEYHAFVFSCRRSLDYLTRALTRYFQQEANSFRQWPKGLRNWRPRQVAEALSAAHERHAVHLDFLMGRENRKSLRDRLAHDEFVDAATINLSARGFRLVGGGEKMGFQSNDRRRLQDVLTERLERVHDCVDDVIQSFIGAARLVDQNSAEK